MTSKKNLWGELPSLETQRTPYTSALITQIQADIAKQ
jgi:hypothetical protein